MCNIKDPMLLLFKGFVAMKVVKIIDQFHIAWIDVWNEIIWMSAIHDSFSEIIYCMSRQNASSHIAYVFDILKIILGSSAVHSRYVVKQEHKMILTVS